MGLTKYTGSTTIFQALSDRPNQNEGFTGDIMKSKFDQPSLEFKNYIDEVLTVEIDALNTENLKKTGDQTLDGIKTFIKNPIVPTPTTNMQASTKKYVDDMDIVRKLYIDNSFTTKNEITANRKLSETGDFSGTVNGQPLTAADPFISSVVAGHTSQLADMATNIINFGAKGGGIVDDTIAIQNAINSLGVVGGTVLFPKKTYLVNGTIFVPSNIKLLGYNTKIINNATTGADGLFNINGSILPTSYNLSLDALKGSSTLTFSTLPLVEVGGALELSQTDFSAIVKVASIDIGNKIITLESPLMHDYLTSLTALVKIVSLVSNVIIDGFDFNFNTTQDLSPIKLYLSENVTIQNIKGIGFGGSNVAIYSSLNFTIKNIKSKNPSSVSPGMGYAVKVHWGSAFGLISNVYSYKTRHCVDISSCSHSISVINCIGVKNTTQAFGLHGAYELNITFEGCKAIACVDGGFTIGNASYFRSSQINIINCTAYFCSIGFNVAIADNVTIVGCKSYYSTLLNYQIISANDIIVSNSESVGQASNIQRATDVLFDVAISKVPTNVDGLWIFNDAKNVRIKGSIKNDMRYGLQIGSTVGGHLPVDNINVNCDIKSNGEFCILVRANVTNLTIDNSKLNAVVGGAMLLTVGASKVIIKGNAINGNISNRIIKNVAIINNIGAVTISDTTTTSAIDGRWIENNYAWVI